MLVFCCFRYSLLNFPSWSNFEIISFPPISICVAVLIFSPLTQLKSRIRVERINIGRHPAGWEKPPTTLLGKLVHKLGLQPRPTQDWIILRCFGSTLEAETFEELQAACSESTVRLRELDLHDIIRVGMDRMPGGEQSDPTAPIPITLHIETKEKQKMSIGTTASGSVSGRDAGLEAEMAMNNYFGTGERLNYKYSLDRSRSSVYEGSFVKPLIQRRQGEVVTVNVVKETVNNSDHSSHKQDRLGLHARYSKGAHQVQYELSWREISLTDKPTQAYARRRRLARDSI